MFRYSLIQMFCITYIKGTILFTFYDICIKHLKNLWPFRIQYARALRDRHPEYSG